MIFLSKFKVFGEVNVRYYDFLNIFINIYFCMIFRLSFENIFFNWVGIRVKNNEVNVILKIKVKRF